MLFPIFRLDHGPVVSVDSFQFIVESFVSVVVEVRKICRPKLRQYGIVGLLAFEIGIRNVSEDALKFVAQSCNCCPTGSQPVVLESLKL